MGPHNDFQSVFGSLDTIGGLSDLARQQSTVTTGANIFGGGLQDTTTAFNSQMFVNALTSEIGPAREYPTKKRSLVEEWREEIESWHGDCLAA